MTGEDRPVQLYVYDLSRGMARMYSRALVGRHIDAVYHTSIVIGGREVYYGAGIQYSRPGQTHHGAPMEVVDLGSTSLPDDVITEFLDSMKEIYSPETYDLFMHNCNNFTNDFSMFLCGKEIPSHITSLPQDVLATPFGQMLRPQLEASIKPITTAASASEAPPSFSNQSGHRSKSPKTSRITIVNNLKEFDSVLQSEKGRKLTTVFFTSASCPPCRTVYPHFEQLAEENSEKASFIKVDISQAYDVGSKFQIRATPTFTTYVNGAKLDEWSGGDPRILKSNFNMAHIAAYPPHPHSKLSLPLTLSDSQNPVIFKKVPPIDKVITKMGVLGTSPEVTALKTFILDRQKKGAIEATLPDLGEWAIFVQTHLKGDLSAAFPIIDLFRVALSDTRVAGWFAEEHGHATITALLNTVTGEKEVPYALRLTSLQVFCNLFTSPLFPPHLLKEPLAPLLSQFVTNSLLDTAHAQARVGAASLAFNVALYNQKRRSTLDEDLLSDDDIASLVASLVEGIEREEESHEAFRGEILALAMLFYGARIDGEVIELVKVLGAGKMISAKGKSAKKELLGDDGARLCREVGGELLIRGMY